MKIKRGHIQRTFLVAAIAVLFAVPAGAATITVNTLDDTIADDGFCSLREAVIAANTNAASGATVGECVAGDPVGTAVDRIDIPAGTYTLTIPPVNDSLDVAGAPNTYVYREYTLTWSAADDKFLPTIIPDATNGDIDITESVNLVGAGKDVTIIDAGWVPGGAVNDPAVDPDVGSTPGLSDRVLHVVSATDDVDAQIAGLTVMGGRMIEITGLNNPAAEEYGLRPNGGGLAVGVAAGTYDIAASGGGQPVIDPGGGGVDFTLDLANVVFMQNYAGDGGGFYNGASTTADRIVISGNHAYANGGGLYNDGALTMTDSTIDGNGAEGGGGIFDTGTGSRSISGSTLSDNGAVGGGAYSGRAGITMNMTNSTVSGNFARDSGGGLLSNGTLNLLHVTVASNTTTADAPFAGSGVVIFPAGGASVIMRGVLLNGNLAGDPATNLADCGFVGGGNIVVTSSGYNLSQDDSCGLGDTTDMPNVDAQLAALANNGGPTLTHALPATSMAVNNGGVLGATKVDQRGEPRDSLPDIGAFEFIAALDADDDDDDGNCFIATAAYGSYLDPKVKVLRDFRDQQLLTNAIGTRFVEFYYRNSPPIADYIRERETLRAIVRSLLAVVIYSIEYPVLALLTMFLFIGLVKRAFRGRKSAGTESLVL